MSTYEMVVTQVSRGFDLTALKRRFWTWWIGLYAEPPRKLPRTML